MKKNKLALVLSTITLMLTLTAIVTLIYAYYVDTETTEPIEFVVGDVSFLYQGDLKEQLVVPGENLVLTPLALTNQSSILTELRMKIEVTSTVTGSLALDDIFIHDLSSDWVLEVDGFYYYRGLDTDQTEIGKYKILTSTTSIAIISNLELDGYVIRNEHEGETITVKITFQAKQADYVNWATLGSQNYDFTTGTSS